MFKELFHRSASGKTQPQLRTGLRRSEIVVFACLFDCRLTSPPAIPDPKSSCLIWDSWRHKRYYVGLGAILDGQFPQLPCETFKESPLSKRIRASPKPACYVCFREDCCLNTCAGTPTALTKRCSKTSEPFRPSQNSGVSHGLSPIRRAHGNPSRVVSGEHLKCPPSFSEEVLAARLT